MITNLKHLHRKKSLPQIGLTNRKYFQFIFQRKMVITLIHKECIRINKNDGLYNRKMKNYKFCTFTKEINRRYLKKCLSSLHFFLKVSALNQNFHFLLFSIFPEFNFQETFLFSIATAVYFQLFFPQ